MASNNEIISDAIKESLSSDKPVDLLFTAESSDILSKESVNENQNNEMNFNYLYIGMSGQRLIDDLNSDLRTTDNKFLEHDNALAIRIMSNQIKEIKVENGVVYYTTDDISDSDEDTRTWIALQSSWGGIVGTLSDQTDLKEALDSKTPISSFNTLSEQVGTNSNNILVLIGDVSDLSDSITSIINTISGTNGILTRLTNAETLLSSKISSSQVLEIRTRDGLSLEFTTDGETWHPVSTTGVIEWGNIIGDIENQADLQLLFHDVYQAIEESTSDFQEELEELETSVSDIQSNLNYHMNNVDNPHSVTKVQIGLGNVDNTSDMDKPVSTAQQAAIDAASGNSYFKSLTHTEYEALTTKETNTIYFINDLDN